MKVVIEDKIVIYLSQAYMPDLDFDNREILEDYFRSLFSVLKTEYDISLTGYITIHIYQDMFYGMIFEISQEELEFFELDDDQVEMKIVLHECTILYNIEEYETFANCESYYYAGKWYLKLQSKIDSVTMGKLLEISVPYYKENVLQILKYGKKI